MLKGRYGIGWMMVAWFALVAIAIIVALAAGPAVTRLLAGAS